MAKAKKIKTNYVIGKTYQFRYQSTSEKKSAETKNPVTVYMNRELYDYCQSYAKKNKKAILERFINMSNDAKEISEHGDLDLKETMKKDFKDKYTTPYIEKDDITVARGMFMRMYSPEGITLLKKGEEADDHTITAMFMGNDVTGNGKITFKWLALNVRMDETKIVEAVKKYIVIEEV